VMTAAASAGHDIRAAIFLSISEDEAMRRFMAVKELNDRGERKDDDNIDVFKNRLREFREKTLPVLEHYHELGLLIEVNGEQSKDAVFSEIVAKLSEKTF